MPAHAEPQCVPAQESVETIPGVTFKCALTAQNDVLAAREKLQALARHLGAMAARDMFAQQSTS